MDYTVLINLLLTFMYEFTLDPGCWATWKAGISGVPVWEGNIYLDIYVAMYSLLGDHRVKRIIKQQFQSVKVQFSFPT